MKKPNLDELETVNFKFEKDAFKELSFVYCCGKKIKKKLVDYQLPNSLIRLKLGIFKCPKCGEEHLDFPNAKLLDKALEINRLLSKKGYSMKRKLSFDGDNFILRVPNDFTKGFGKKVIAELKPVSNDSFLVEIRKSDGIES